MLPATIWAVFASLLWFAALRMLARGGAVRVRRAWLRRLGVFGGAACFGVALWLATEARGVGIGATSMTLHVLATLLAAALLWPFIAGRPA